MIATDANIQRAILDKAHRQTYHEQDGKAMVNTYQDVEPHLEYAARCRREEWERRGQFGKRGEFRRTMVIPFNIMLSVAEKLGIPAGQIFDSDHQKRIGRELKSHAYKYFRTTNDKHIGG